MKIAQTSERRPMLRATSPQWFRVQQAAGEGEATVYIYDVVDPWFGIGAADFARALNGIDADTIHLHLNSPGGDVFDGFAIFNTLKAHDARVVVHVDGLAASIASIIAMAGDEIRMGEGSFLMIHNPWALGIGEADDFRKIAANLDQIRDNGVGVYARRSGADPEQIAEWMADETWFTASEAVAAGFADVAEEDEPAQRPKQQHDLTKIYNNVPDALRVQEPAKPEPRTVNTIRELEAALREEVGLSIAAAKAVASGGFKALSDHRDDGGEEPPEPHADAGDDLTSDEVDELAAALHHMRAAIRPGATTGV